MAGLLSAAQQASLKAQQDEDAMMNAWKPPAPAAVSAPTATPAPTAIPLGGGGTQYSPPVGATPTYTGAPQTGGGGDQRPTAAPPSLPTPVMKPPTSTPANQAPSRDSNEYASWLQKQTAGLYGAQVGVDNYGNPVDKNGYTIDNNPLATSSKFHPSDPRYIGNSNFGNTQSSAYVAPTPVQNFGANAALNQKLAALTGYKGNFSGGGFSDFQKTLSPQMQAEVAKLIAQNGGQGESSSPPSYPPGPNDEEMSFESWQRNQGTGGLLSSSAVQTGGADPQQDQRLGGTVAGQSDINSSTWTNPYDPYRRNMDPIDKQKRDFTRYNSLTPAQQNQISVMMQGERQRAIQSFIDAREKGTPFVPERNEFQIMNQLFGGGSSAATGTGTGTGTRTGTGTGTSASSSYSGNERYTSAADAPRNIGTGGLDPNLNNPTIGTGGLDPRPRGLLNGSRNWGMNTELNRTIAAQTGYRGDFGSGGYEQSIRDGGRAYDASLGSSPMDYVQNGAAGFTGGTASIARSGSTGYAADSASARDAGSTGYESQDWKVTPEQQVEDRLNRILGNDSPLMQQAGTQAAQVANSRGLLNSSMAVTAGQDALIRSALPIAQQDAQTNAAAGQANAAATNTARQFGAGAQNQADLQNSQLGTNVNLSNAASSNTAKQFTAGSENQSRLANAQIEMQTNLANTAGQNAAAQFSAGAQNAQSVANTEAGSREAIAQLNAQTQLTMAQFDAKTKADMQAALNYNNQLVQTNQTAAAMANQYSQIIANIQNNKDMDGPAKQAAMNAQLEAYRRNLDTIGNILGFRLGRYWETADYTGYNQGGTGGTGGTDTTTPPVVPKVGNN